ncbi:MAG: anthranilate phosphoribosyltransferase [Candidatus Omnitrophica bacterium]|nr:anthranilate phosphoribosyltransferase [Candidatus Omnitrophota bacterium]
MIKEILNNLAKNEDLDFEQAEKVFEQIFDSKLSHVQIAAFLVALKMKGESEAEIAAAATVVRKRAKKLNRGSSFMQFDPDKPIFDTCGTGGSNLNKFNVSSATAFIVAASGVCVAKHGNKAISSNCGSADVLERLGIDINSPLGLMQESLNSLGIAFLYAPLYHPALGAVAKIRKELGVRTIFNILGPLCNPAMATHQLLGVYSKELVLPLARVLRILGTKKAFVVNGKDVGDEISLTGTTYVGCLKGRKITSFRLNPSDFGLKKINIKDIMVRDCDDSASVVRNILEGRKGAARDIVLANASACFCLLDKVKDLKEGVRLASLLIDEGKAREVLVNFKKFLKENA